MTAIPKGASGQIVLKMRDVQTFAKFLVIG